MQEQDNTFSADLSRRGVLMGAAAGGLVIAGGGAMLAPSANAATAAARDAKHEVSHVFVTTLYVGLY